MDDRAQLFLQETGPTLCVDIGEVMQFALLARPGQECWLWPRFSLPSPSRMVAQRIRELTLLKRPLWLYGQEIGGEFAAALREHMAAGLPAAASAKAARSMHGDLEMARHMGLAIEETRPDKYTPIYCCDFDPAFWRSFLALAELPLPRLCLAATHDLGQGLEKGHEERARYWRSLLDRDANPISWIHAKAPESRSRLKALQELSGGPVADSATCAILGALCQEDVFERVCRKGAAIIYAGETYAFAALAYKEKICGLYEGNSEKRDLELLLEDVEQFGKHWQEELGNRDEKAGIKDPGDLKDADFSTVYLLGPKRELLKEHGTLSAPHGDTAHAGCFGLLYGWSRAHARIGQ